MGEQLSSQAARQPQAPAFATRVTELLGTRYPIIQGGMAWVAEAHLAAAVSEAGGLGIIACGAASPAWVEGQIDLLRSMTDKPFGVNVMLMSEKTSQLAEVIARKQVPVITTGAGDPAAYMELWKNAGCKVVPVVASAALAKRMEKRGADAVIAEGCEAGGHIGELTTMALTPAVCEAVSIPVITAGGVADGRGMAAAFVLGAEGVQVGTRFLTAHECTIHPDYKAKVVAARDSDTVVTGRSSGHPVRGLKNRFAREARKLEAENALPEGMFSGSLHRAVEGDVNGGSLMAGQVACLVDDEKPVAVIIDELMDELARWSQLDAAAMAARNAERAWHSTGKDA